MVIFPFRLSIIISRANYANAAVLNIKPALSPALIKVRRIKSGLRYHATFMENSSLRIK